MVKGLVPVGRTGSVIRQHPDYKSRVNSDNQVEVRSRCKSANYYKTSGTQTASHHVMAGRLPGTDAINQYGWASCDNSSAC